jgi:hypothetical protein
LITQIPYVLKFSKLNIIPIDILMAGPKNGSSFTWQSIVAGIQTFKRGCIWRVGSGENIKIRSDPWVPVSPNRKIISPRGDCILTRVSELIHPYRGQWDQELILNVFILLMQIEPSRSLYMTMDLRISLLGGVLDQAPFLSNPLITQNGDISLMGVHVDHDSVYSSK